MLTTLVSQFSSGLGLDLLPSFLVMTRVPLGAFFAIMGAFKLFTRASHRHMVATMRRDHVPLPVAEAWFVSGVEFFAGLALVTGCLTSLAASGLLVTCLVATCIDCPSRIKREDPASYYIDFLYLPEPLYLFPLALLVVAGPGRLALSSLIGF